MSFQFVKFSLKPFHMLLKNPLKMGDSILKNRTGYIVRLTDKNGVHGEGEISPFPGLHKETLRQTIQSLDSITPKLRYRTFTISDLSLTSPLFGILCEQELKGASSSVLFGLESAVVSWLKKVDNNLFTRSFNANKWVGDVPVNGLFIPGKKIASKDKMKKLLDEWHLCGITTVKIKVGTEGRFIAEDIDTINTINQLSEHSLSLRIDGNRRLVFEDYLQLMASIDTDNVDYVEEPLALMNRWEEAYSRKKVPLAIDESLRDLLEESFDQIAQKLPVGTKAWVLKPTVTGGISKTLELIALGQKLGVVVVISSTFDSPVAMNLLKLLAHQQNQIKLTPAGLDTLRFF
ncbi:MAG: o-succinylbenzoate synthase [Bacteriovoracaceae bacterium]|nr:o-succinylbenzoate synthase [Bacteriovoracaceae bacterium]